MSKEKPYHSLLAWQTAHHFVLEIYKELRNFPNYELYGIVSQLRRAVISVANNIVEGHAKKKYPSEFLRFLRIAKGSLDECEYLLEVSRDLGYISVEKYEELEMQRGEVGFYLFRLIKSLESPSKLL